MPPTETAILERIIEAEQADLSSEVAHYLLLLDFRPQDRQRLEALSARAREGTITAAEEAELENYRRVAQLLQRLRTKAQAVLASQPPSPPSPDPSFQVPPGILRSQQAFWRDLPELLKKKRNHGKWVCYYGDEQIGVADSSKPLIRECLRRGLDRGEYDLFIVRQHDVPPWEPEEVESIKPQHLQDVSPNA